MRSQKRGTSTKFDEDQQESSPPAPRQELAQPEETIKSSSTTTNPPVPSIFEREHPFRTANDANYKPPQLRNFGAAPALKPQASAAKNDAPAAATMPETSNTIEDVSKMLSERSLDAKITITQRELLAISADLREHYRRVLNLDKSTSTTPTNNINSHSSLMQELYEKYNKTCDYNEHNSATTANALPQSQHRSPPVGAYISSDPIEVYLNSLPPGEEPDYDRLVVAKESSPLRSVLPLIDNNLKVESILDPGCQIVAMSEEVCHVLSITYDPNIKLNMQSVNGSINQSLGLARNIPFFIGGLTLYLQVHIIQKPAYDILLGRPFDVLTESIVSTYKNDNTTVTIHDPNSNRVITVPTVP